MTGIDQALSNVAISTPRLDAFDVSSAAPATVPPVTPQVVTGERAPIDPDKQAAGRARFAAVGERPLTAGAEPTARVARGLSAPVAAAAAPPHSGAALPTIATPFDEERNGTTSSRISIDHPEMVGLPLEHYVRLELRAEGRGEMINANVPTAVADAGRRSTVKLTLSRAGGIGFGSGVLARANVDGEARIVMLTTVHSFKGDAKGDTPLRDSEGRPLTPSDFTVVAEAMTGAKVVVPVDKMRTNFKGNAAERDVIAFVLPPEVAQALAPAEGLAALPPIGAPQQMKPAYGFGCPGYTRLDTVSPTGPGAPADTRLLVGTENFIFPPRHAGMLGSQVELKPGDARNGEGSSGGPVLQMASDGTIEVVALVSRANPIQNTGGFVRYAEGLAALDDPLLGFVEASRKR